MNDKNINNDSGASAGVTGYVARIEKIKRDANALFSEVWAGEDYQLAKCMGEVNSYCEKALELIGERERVRAKLQRELDSLIKQRNKMSDKLAKSFMDGTFTRSRITTANANLGHISERIDFLRREIAAIAI